MRRDRDGARGDLSVPKAALETARLTKSYGTTDHGQNSRTESVDTRKSVDSG